MELTTLVLALLFADLGLYAVAVWADNNDEQ